ncbi:TetR/AcrR family transcriptional regulator [Roseibium sediminicola]|uniref:TetR/AcrR family transcriptional regulator n=1 Tax=Roseibium sediminicola TaxID=2933272 RepID=A0ABT0GS06_9HYPH|nr:TetR/AcrR family transcriptional regulator [Roseibium sp. CAU 1639]MCK7611593.1 TetR/AcrR family transcriptional regulator [Roseibium sp. CAU 1639]
MSKQTKRGRPRQFDEDQTLDQIMQVFWRHGFAATSLDQISEATGLNRPSLYAAFGSKKDMYLKIISRFADQMHTYLAAAGRTPSGAHARLKAVMAAAIDLYTGHSPLSHAAYGCLAVSTLPSETVDDSDFQMALSAVLRRMDDGFAELIRHEASGRLDEDEIAVAARHLSLLLHGLSIRARAGEPSELLKTLAASAVDRLVPPIS